jgi:DNA polymerase III epsilon subunit-like protein
MIIVDIETTGLDSRIHQMLSIGAVDSKTGETFYGECRVYKKDILDPRALAVNGFTEAEARDPKKMTPKQLYDSFLAWCKPRSNTLVTCNISFDQSFLRKVNYEAGYPFDHFPFRRCLDLYTMAYIKLGEPMSLKKMCTKLGIEPEPEVHNALTGAQKAHECLKHFEK